MQSLHAQSYQITSGQLPSRGNLDRAALFDYDRRANFLYEDKIADRTSYPFVETNISLNSGWYAFQAFLYDGAKISYSTRGERNLFQQCSGDVCFILTDRNFLGISNYASEWSKSSFYNEGVFKSKFGNKAFFTVTERNVYLYNGYLNDWVRIGLESENVVGVSNKNELAVVITSKRIFFFQLPNQQVLEIGIIAKPISRFEIKTDTIECYSQDRVFQYDAKSNQSTEVRLDGN